MGNNESNDGVLLAKEGTILTRFPMVEVERVAFLLYYMNIIPRVITHMPTVTKRAKMSSGRDTKRIVFIYVVNNVIKHIHRHWEVTVASWLFSVLISVSINLAKFKVIPHKKIAYALV